jgi:hypothetical protein
MKRIDDKLVRILCQAIKERRLVRFYYLSNSGEKAWRTVEPYMVINNKGNITLIGLPTTELNKAIKYTGHYLLLKIDIKKFETLDECYDEPKVPREQIVNTPTVKVICRFIIPMN